MVMHMNNSCPLRYRISDFRQLDKCLSNNSRDLKIVTTTFINDKRLNGLRISVIHSLFGTLFSYVVGAKGSMISKSDYGPTYELTTGQILEELKKYGFYIEYNPVESLPGNQIQYLMTLQKLHFDKIRILSVWDTLRGVKEFKVYVVAFKADPNGDWLNAGYSPSLKEYTKAVNEGTAFNISAISETNDYHWDWLYNWVADIDDILKDQSGACRYEC